MFSLVTSAQQLAMKSSRLQDSKGLGAYASLVQALYLHGLLLTLLNAHILT